MSSRDVTEGRVVSLSARYAAWTAFQHRTILLCMAVFSFSAIFLISYLRIIFDQYSAQTPGHPASYVDFFALWSYAKIASTNGATELYDAATLHARQVGLGMEPAYEKPFPYPPMFLFLLWPLNFLPYDLGYLTWTAGTLTVLIWVLYSYCSRSVLCAVGVLLAPATAASIFAGQSGFLAASLLTAGLQLAKRQPILAGLLIGLLCYKPQLGLLVPVALASAGLWRTFGAACLTVLGMAVTATVLFGWKIWQAWIDMLPAYSYWFDHGPVMPTLMPTVSGNLRMMGCSLFIANAGQALTTFVVMVLVWLCYKHGPGRLATAALLAGTFLATPHALFYDLPIVTAAMALFISERLETGATFSSYEVMALVLTMMLPAFMLTNIFHIPVTVIPLILLFVAIVRRNEAGSGEPGGSSPITQAA